MKRSTCSPVLVCLLSIGSVMLLDACVPKPVQAPLKPVHAAPESTAVRPKLPTPYAVRTMRTRSNLRSEPTTSGAILSKLDAGEKIGLLTVKDGWYQVLVDSTTGWVWGPLVKLTRDDKWSVAMSAARVNMPGDSIFVAVYQDDNILRVVLNIAWRNMTERQKERIVDHAGEVWQHACKEVGLTPAPGIRFMSNNKVEMARWHPFWGTHVEH